MGGFCSDCATLVDCPRKRHRFRLRVRSSDKHRRSRIFKYQFEAGIELEDGG